MGLMSLTLRSPVSMLKESMTQDVQKLQELTAHLQQEVAAMHDELYAQQQEIMRLTVEMRHLNDKIKSMQHNDGILNPADDTPPPHY